MRASQASTCANARQTGPVERIARHVQEVALAPAFTTRAASLMNGLAGPVIGSTDAASTGGDHIDARHHRALQDLFRASNWRSVVRALNMRPYTVVGMNSMLTISQ